jgi:hypothetical protein
MRTTYASVAAKSAPRDPPDPAPGEGPAGTERGTKGEGALAEGEEAAATWRCWNCWNCWNCGNWEMGLPENIDYVNIKHQKR